tara:strand:- start:2401 stop:3666 length:1266 start_codon:yes stop_codon:yes gene_type:complete
MNFFDYQKNIMFAEDVAIPDLAEEVGTPFYCYSTAALKMHFKKFSEALRGLNFGVYFSVKSNSNIAVIKTLADEGAGADVVSEGEMRRALSAQIPGRKIVFSGVGKTPEEIKFALLNDIFQINVESYEELRTIEKVAAAVNKTAPISIRINPDIDAKTHMKISTGTKENKFGISWDKALNLFDVINTYKHIQVKGLAVHIGSQLIDLDPFKKTFDFLAEGVKILINKGINIKTLDLGGGLGVTYSNEKQPSMDDYAKIVKKSLGQFDCHLMFEPGRAISANSGILVTKIIYIKKTSNKIFLIVDAAMNDFIRPTLYEANHEILPVIVKSQPFFEKKVDIVGPVCETGDYLAENISLPEAAQNELIAIKSAGAYGSVMSSNYNSRLLISEVLVKNSNHAIIRKRQSYEDLLRNEKFAPWQKK